MCVWEGQNGSFSQYETFCLFLKQKSTWVSSKLENLVSSGLSEAEVAGITDCRRSRGTVSREF